MLPPRQSVHRSFLPRHGGQAVLIIAAVLLSSCGGSIGPVTPIIPVQPRTIAIEGTTIGTVNDEFPLAAVVTFDDASKETVTSKAVWTTSNSEVATISAQGLLHLKGPGEADVTVSYTVGGQKLEARARAVSEERPAATYTLFGTLSDVATNAPVFDSEAMIVGGPNNGRTAITDSNGYYSIPALLGGAFVLRFTTSGYETIEQQIDLTGDTRRDFKVKEVPLPTFSNTYNISIATTTNTCANIKPGASGTITLNGTARDLHVSITEKRGSAPDYTRADYRGTMRVDGSFTVGVNWGVTNLDVRTHEYRGGISGKVTGNTIVGTEDMTITLGCSENSQGALDVGRIVLEFSGSR